MRGGDEAIPRAERSAPAGAPPRMLVPGLVAAAIVIAVAAAVVLVLNVRVYSADALVSSYLSALHRQDARAALALPGVDPADDPDAAGALRRASRTLLRDGAIEPADASRITGDRDADGERIVRVESDLGGRTATTDLRLVQTPPLLGVFRQWRFATSPLAVARITVENADTFRVAGVTVDPRASATSALGAFSSSADYLLFAPSAVRLSQRSELTTAATVAIVAEEPGAMVRGHLVAMPDRTFDDRATAAVRRYLAACAAQPVLQPAGCPFGTEIDDRVEGAPAWSIASRPDVEPAAGDTGWRTRPTEGVAHLSVMVRSLYDGSVSTVERDIPFELDVDLRLDARNRVTAVGR